MDADRDCGGASRTFTFQLTPLLNLVRCCLPVAMPMLNFFRRESHGRQSIANRLKLGKREVQSKLLRSANWLGIW